MSGTSPKVCAVILNMTNTPCLLECLGSLGGVSYENLEIIVVYNGPRSGDFEKAVRRVSSRVSDVLFTGYNSGFAAGNNAGIRRSVRAGADYVLLLNDDTVVAADFLSLLVARAESVPGIGMLGPRIYYLSQPDTIWFSGAAFDREKCSLSFPGSDLQAGVYGHEGPAETAYVTGCALLVSRRVIESVGLLDETFFLYWEDSDWGLRATAAGFRIEVLPAAKIWHKVSASSGGNDSPLKAYHKTKGHLFFARRHSPRAVPRLLRGFIRDVAWLVFKSGARNRFRRAAACLAGIAGYLAGTHGPGIARLKRRT
jgi:GT2 family glycosyltransferase